MSLNMPSSLLVKAAPHSATCEGVGEKELCMVPARELAHPELTVLEL